MSRRFFDPFSQPAHVPARARTAAARSADVRGAQRGGWRAALHRPGRLRAALTRRGYRTTPLRGLFTRLKGAFYHDGRFPTYEPVVDHYDRVFSVRLTAGERRDLVEYLKSL